MKALLGFSMEMKRNRETESQKVRAFLCWVLQREGRRDQSNGSEEFEMERRVSKVPPFI